MAWIKLKAIESTIVGCVSCGPKPKLFPPTSIIAVGFGSATLLKGDELVWDEQQGDTVNKYMTGAEAEELAAKDPDHDWQIRLYAPLSNRTYQRHGPEEWALVEQGMGFA